MRNASVLPAWAGAGCSPAAVARAAEGWWVPSGVRQLPQCNTAHLCMAVIGRLVEGGQRAVYKA